MTTIERRLRMSSSSKVTRESDNWLMPQLWSGGRLAILYPIRRAQPCSPVLDLGARRGSPSRARHREDGMKRLLIAPLVTTCLSLPVLAQDSKTVVEAAARAMGATSLESIQYSGIGSVFMFGQAARPDAPWPRFKVVKYVTAVNYNGPALREELVRTEVESTPHGGGAGGFNPATGQGGMRPLIGEQTQIRQATTRTDAGRLQIWMTPHGFLKAAAANNAIATTAGGRKTVSFSTGKHTVTGTLNDQNLVERVETLVDNPVLGDMPV